MYLIIDNYDSFTYNLVHCVSKASSSNDIQVIRNDKITVKEVKSLQPKAIFISPGPGTPDETGNAKSVIKAFYKDTPICGICLGHQLIAQAFGSKVTRSKEVIHGKPAKITTDGIGVYKRLPKELSVGRYHSLSISSLEKDFQISATTKNGLIMSIRHKEIPHLIGLQYHPESILTPEGVQIIKNFLVIGSA